MPKIDAYLKSIEKFGAAGAILVSGQPVTLRFPTGDRHATQVTPHDQLVGMVREVAPPNVLDQIDQHRPARFEHDASGMRYALSVAPRPGSWHVTIEPASAPPPPPAAPPPARAPRTAAIAPDAGDMAIERGQYDEVAARPTSSGSPLLDALTAAARTARATDVILATGAVPAMRVDGRLAPVADRGALDAETISRELGIVAPGDERALWTERGVGLFTYGDGAGRIRVALGRDHRGPSAVLRLLPGEPPALDRLGVPREVAGWLDQRGLVIVAGASGAGKTTTLAALVRALGEKRRRVVAIEDPIEIVHTGEPLISQRAVGDHVPSVAAGVAAAIREGADAIVVGAAGSGEAALAVVEAVAAGHLVLTTIAAGARVAAGQLCDLVPVDRRDQAHRVVGEALLGTLAVLSGDGGRSFGVHPGSRS